jgi:hypothetical protein
MLNLRLIPAAAAANDYGDRPVKLPWIGLVCALALAACDRPATPAKPAGTALPMGVERAGPVTWNATTSGFEMAGQPLKILKIWTFDGSTDGYTALHSKIEPAAGQGLQVTVADPTIRSPKGLNVAGGQYSMILVRLTRTAAAGAWDGALYYSTPKHSEEVAFFGKPTSGANPAVGETTTLVYDMSRQTAGGPDWLQSTIDQIRFDLEDKPGGMFVIRQIAIVQNPNAKAAPEPKAEPAAPASAAAPKP